MGFFSFKQKRLAKKNSYNTLVSNYAKSEFELERAACSGDTKQLKKAMKTHSNYEYAMLYQNTPQFKKKRKK